MIERGPKTPASLRIRLMGSVDLTFADSLRSKAGWNQTVQDWQRFLLCEPEGCFVAEWEGELAGTATITGYGKELGWVGMVLVDPEHRRKGIGSALLQHSLACLESRGVRCIKLDATPQGKPLYEGLGFIGEWSLTRWEASTIPAGTLSQASHSSPGQELDLDQIVALDKQAFGVSRRDLLRHLAGQNIHTIVSDSGYGMLRPGTRAAYLGPIVAISVETGLNIVRELLAQVPNAAVYWDVPDLNTAATALAQELGFREQRRLLRMVRGANTITAKPQLQFGIVDPAVG